METASLQTRVDRKYLVPAAAFSELMAQLDDRMTVLEIAERRMFGYESTYFDTPALLAFHQHAHGRRRRFKARTRTYLDSAETMLEIKTKGGRAETIKDRYPYDLADRHRLTPAARRIIGDYLGDAAVAGELEASLINRYQRATLVDTQSGTRMTCDIKLVFQNRHHTDVGPADLVLVESKTVGSAGPADSLLWQLGHRPVSISKYCVGLAMLHPQLPANRWNRTLRRTFGWSPERGDRCGERVV